MEQQTLAASFTLEGIGIHTGAVGRVTVHPAEADTGRVFRTGNVTFPARADFVVDTMRCTTLRFEDVRISTVEHLLSALSGLNVDNAILEVEGPEIPILDGSALPFVEAILSAGIVGQGKPPKTISPRSHIEIDQGAGRMEAWAQDSFSLLVNLAFQEWPDGDISIGTIPVQTYAAQIAPARTFAFRQEVDQLIAAGLAKGGSLDNALIITPPDEFSSPLRLQYEWAYHKILDLIGDLALLNARPMLNVIATLPGHRANVRLAQEILNQNINVE